MIRLVSYTYQFLPCRVKELSLFDDSSALEKDPMENKQLIFRKIMESDVVFLSKKKQYASKLIYRDDDFYVFKLASQHKITLENDFQKQKHIDSPSSLVIIDNRKDVQHIAIEENSNAFDSTDMIAGILASTFNRYLSKSNLRISVRKEFRSSEFWNYVDKYRGSIKMVRFQFSYPNLPRVSEAIDTAILNSSKGLRSERTVLEYNSDKEQGLSIESSNETVGKLVKASSDSGNTITLKIRGIRKYVKTGETSKYAEVEECELDFHRDLLDSVCSKIKKIMDRFNDER